MITCHPDVREIAYSCSCTSGRFVRARYPSNSIYSQRYTHYIISKFQPNPLTITEEIKFLRNFQEQQLGCSFSQTRNFTITNLKRHNSTSHASIDLIFFFNVPRNLLYQCRLHLGKSIFRLCIPFAGTHHKFS